MKDRFWCWTWWSRRNIGFLQECHINCQLSLLIGVYLNSKDCFIII